MNGLSLFSGGGISEVFFNKTDVKIKVANELLPERSSFYKFLYPSVKMIQGDITNAAIFSEVIRTSKEEKVNFIIATPPCQGMSTLGKKKYSTDERNSLFKVVLNSINMLNPDYILIENVPKFLKIYFNIDGTTYTGTEPSPLRVSELLETLYSNTYEISIDILNSQDYSIPQSRPRAIIRMFKKGLSWCWPQKSNKIITLEEAIGDLPSLMPGEKSSIKWHNARPHNKRHIEALIHTPEGKSALNNSIYYPKKKDGSRVRGFHNTYKRMKWNEPAPARTTNNYVISGHNNVHPGRKLQNGLQSDPRVLTLRELIIVSSLPLNWNLPENFNENLVREMIGEAIPPLLSKKIVEQIGKVT